LRVCYGVFIATGSWVERGSGIVRIGINGRPLTAPLTGIGRYTFEMTQALLRQGADIVLFTPSPITCQFEPVQGKLEIVAGNVTRRIGRQVWEQATLPRLVNRRDVDVLWGPAHRLPGGLRPNIRKIVTIHDLVWRHAPKTMRKANRLLETLLMPQAIAGADAIVTVSEATRADVLRQWPALTTPMRTIYPGHTMHQSLPAAVLSEKWGISGPYCLFIGTMEPRKNLHRLLRAFALLPQEISNVRLVIAGGAGWGGVDIAQEAQKLGIGEKLLTTGYVDDAELATLLHHAKALAMPSLYEGFGLPIIDAMAHGVPVLTSNLSSMPEVAGGAAILVDPLDVTDMARGVAEVLGDETKRAALRRNGLARAKILGWDKAAAEFLEFVAER
jgi:glycosyltransferase involved in cell wall biosynthesis